MKLWIVGKPSSSDDSARRAWEFQGVFDTRARAIAACTGVEHFMFPASLNERLPEETIGPAGIEFPRQPRPSGRKGERPR